MFSKGRILQLQHFSVNDGEGIRTIIFFAGCFLRCQWCANPEGYTAENQILYIPSLCTQCGACTVACPQGLPIDLNLPGARLRCDGCGACVAACLDKARKNTVRDMTVQDILDELEPQLPYFHESGGGVTYSGGECTNQAAFLDELSQAVYDLGLNQAMETSATFDRQVLQPVLERMDLLFLDIKHMDSACHRKWTGQGNEHILDNIAALGESRTGLVARIPLIMGVNGDDDNIRKTAAFVKDHFREPKLELLPYHMYGVDKYAQLGLAYAGQAFRTPTAEEMKHLGAIVEACGVDLVSYR